LSEFFSWGYVTVTTDDVTCKKNMRDNHANTYTLKPKQITRKNITDNLAAFNFRSLDDVAEYEKMLKKGFETISEALAAMDQVFVDTKFEFGYVVDSEGKEKLIYMDEVGTPDSSRIWDGPSYRNGTVVENSKEGFRQQLLKHFPDADVFTNKNRMEERKKYATELLPQQMLMDVSKTYLDIAAKITGAPIVQSEDPRGEIIAVLKSKYNLIKDGSEGL
jgi:phosphoribosylaminoimidazole-succinocarboxamide synthase